MITEKTEAQKLRELFDNVIKLLEDRKDEGLDELAMCIQIQLLMIDKTDEDN